MILEVFVFRTDFEHGLQEGVELRNPGGGTGLFDKELADSGHPLKNHLRLAARQE